MNPFTLNKMAALNKTGLSIQNMIQEDCVLHSYPSLGAISVRYAQLDNLHDIV